MADLVIRISGDIKNYEEALDKASSETEGLSNTLSSVAAKSAIAFAALTAEIGLTVAAYKETEKTANALNSALQNQGIYSKELAADYQKQATEIQNLSGISDEAVLKAQTSVQAYLGQTKVTKDLTLAIANFATAQKVDLSTAAELVGKSVGTGTNALTRYGVEVDATAPKADKLAQVIAQLNGRYAGQAEAAGKGLGSLVILKETFGDLQETIGQRFAPAIESIAGIFTKFFNTIINNRGLVDLIASLLFAGSVVTGLIAIVSGAGVAFLALRAALVAANIQISATTIAVRGLVGATGLGLLIVALSYILLNWEKTWTTATAIFKAFADNISSALGGVGQILSGVFNGNIDDVIAGGKKLKEAFAKGFNEASAKINPPDISNGNKQQDEALKKLAEKRQAEEKKKEELLIASKKAQSAALLLEAQRGSTELIKLKQEESALLKQISDETNAQDKASYQQKLDDNRLLQSQANERAKEERAIFNEEILAQNEEFEALSDEQKQEFLIKNQQALQEQVDTAKESRQKAAADNLAIQIKEHNDFLANQQKFGTAYALINQIMHSAIVQGTAKAFGELAALQQSSNSTLKSIGKAAATANVLIKTAESAMNIYAGFSTIPIVGPALGIAGAAAAVAFGGEQVSKINAAQDGGLLEGGIPGVDSIPVLAQQGELITPRRNFDEVVNAVAAQRAGTQGENQQQSAAPAGPIEIVLRLADNLMEFIEVQQNERDALGISVRTQRA